MAVGSGRLGFVDQGLDERYVERCGERPKSLRVRANGTELHLLQWGDPDAQPVLLVHGMRGHARWFTPVGPVLGRHFRALSLVASQSVVGRAGI